ncbi:MAG: TIM barrel protein [Candidatus Paceibacterota bacterium]|jgi:deoxyribonuclease-4
MQNTRKPLTIGYHARASTTSKRRDYVRAIDEAYAIITESVPDVCPCCALFISGPRNSHVNVSHEVARMIGARATGCVLFHAAYVDLPFSATDAQDAVFARIDTIVTTCMEARADVVIHTSSRFFDYETCAFVVPRLLQCVRAHGREAREYGRIFLETMSFDERFANPDAINDIFARFFDGEPNIGMCVDTAHIWAAGADISTRESCTAWFEALAPTFPIALHLNDSYNPLGTHRDKHACLGEGEIWNASSRANDGYIAILLWAREHGVHIILERNGGDDEVSRDLATVASKLNYDS